MRRLLLLALAFTTATSSSGLAQNTWKNLHFGESRDEVRSQLATQNIPVGTSPDSALQSNTDYQLPMPGLRHTFPMVVNVHFDDNDTLADVTLSLDLPAVRRYWPTLGTDEALDNFAAEHLISALSGRYGAPLYLSAACNAQAEKFAAGCTLIWHGNEQTVQLERTSTPRGPRLLIRYLPLTTEL